MPDILGFSPRPLEPEELLAHGERLLEPPLERWTDPAQADRPAVRGTYAGRRTTLYLSPVIFEFTDDGTSTFQMRMEGRTYGLVCTVGPPAVLNRTGPPLGDPEFDARFDVVGMPRAVLNELFDADTRGLFKKFPASLRVGADVIELAPAERARSAEDAAALLATGARLLDRLPEAIRAAGAGQYLELGSLATHPELASAARQQSRRRSWVLAVLAIVLGLGLLLAIATALIGYVLFAR